MTLKSKVKSTPVVGVAAKSLWQITGPLRFRLSAFQSSRYWDSRYAKGGNSGTGSYGDLAAFKARILNEFVARKNIKSIAELGCGDGNQLLLSQYPRYVGYDVSSNAIKRCKNLFSQDSSKRFVLLDGEYRGCGQAEVSLSLDVIYHLVEDDVYEQHMKMLFAAASRYVVIYSDNTESRRDWIHVRHRRFSDWIERHCPEWVLAEHIPNEFPWKPDAQMGSWADFWIYARKTAETFHQA
jgi:SAM-dependent methyltransferase